MEKYPPDVYDLLAWWLHHQTNLRVYSSAKAFRNWIGDVVKDRKEWKRLDVILRNAYVEYRDQFAPIEE